MITLELRCHLGYELQNIDALWTGITCFCSDYTFMCSKVHPVWICTCSEGEFGYIEVALENYCSIGGKKL